VYEPLYRSIRTHAHTLWHAALTGSAKYLQAYQRGCFGHCSREQEAASASILNVLLRNAASEAQCSRQQQPLEPSWQHVLSYVGRGHWWYVSTVCSLWRDMYRRLESVQVVSYDGRGLNSNITCTPQMTLFSAVFASAARVRLAEASLDCRAERYRSAAGKYANVEALAAAVELGMPYFFATMHGCALRNTLAVMQYLHAKGCHWNHLVCTAAAERGCFEMLRWAREHGCEWDQHTILSSAASSGDIELTAWVNQQPAVHHSSEAMGAAAARGHTAMCEYLRAEGIPWHDLVCWAAAANAKFETLRWLREHGVCFPAFACHMHWQAMSSTVHHGVVSYI
jgi:hypothetical protein